MSVTDFVKLLDPEPPIAGKVLRLRIVLGGSVVSHQTPVWFLLLGEDGEALGAELVTMAKQRDVEPYTFRVKIQTPKQTRVGTRVVLSTGRVGGGEGAFGLSKPFDLRSKSAAQLKRKRDKYQKEKEDKRQRQAHVVALATGLPVDPIPPARDETLVEE
jgi:hypothetical protein